MPARSQNGFPLSSVLLEFGVDGETYTMGAGRHDMTRVTSEMTMQVNLDFMFLIHNSMLDVDIYQAR